MSVHVNKLQKFVGTQSSAENGAIYSEGALIDGGGIEHVTFFTDQLLMHTFALPLHTFFNLCP